MFPCRERGVSDLASLIPPSRLYNPSWHECPLSASKWPWQRQAAKIALILMLVPTPLPLAFILIGLWLGNWKADIPMNFSEKMQESLRLLAYGSIIFSEIWTIAGLLFGTIGLLKKSLCLLASFTYMMYSQVVYSGVALCVDLYRGRDLVTIGIHVCMVVWFILLYRFSLYHLRKLKICRDCY